MFIAMNPRLRFPEGPNCCTISHAAHSSGGTVQDTSVSGILSETCLALWMHLVGMAMQAGIQPKTRRRETCPVNNSLC